MTTIYPKDIYIQYYQDMQKEYLKFFNEKKHLGAS